MRDQEKINQPNKSGVSSGKENNSNDPIRASDASRNNERDLRIGEEPDTRRVRSEKESVEKRGKK